MALTQLTKVDGGGISTTSDYRVGVITASKFVGPFDGSGGNFSGVVTATNGVFSGNISAVDGTFSGNVSIAGTLTYEDVTNIDSVGIITAQKDIHVGAGVSVVGIVTAATGDFFDLDVDGHTELDNGNVSGVVTFTNSPNAIQMNDGARVSFGNSLKTSISYVSSDSRTKIRNYNDTLEIGYRNTEIHHSNVARLTFDSGNTFSNAVNTQFAGANYHAVWIPSSNLFRLNDNAKLAFGSQTDATIHHNNSHLYLQNTNGNIDVTGNVVLNNDISVDGHTNLDNVSVSGVSTVTTFLQVFGQAGTSDRGFEVRANSTQNTDTNQAIRVRNNSNTDTFKVSYKGYVNNRVTELTEHLTTPTIYLSDSILHHGDLNTKIRFPAADTFTVETAGSERLRIASDGKIGFGDFSSTSLYHPLHLKNAMSSSPSFIHMEVTGSNTVGGGGGIAFDTSASNNQNNNSKYLATITGVRNSSDDGSNDLVFSTSKNSINNDLPLEKLRIDSDGNITLKDTAAQGNSLVHFIKATDVNGASQYQLGMVSSGNQDLYLIQSRNANLRFQTSGATRWKIDGDPGHLLPETAGAVDIGSTSAEIGNVYLADDKRVYFGTDQDLSIYSSGSDSFFENSVGHTYFRNSSGTSGGLLFRSDGETHISNYAANEYRIKTFNQGAVELFFAAGTYSTPKLKTSATGITVDGEVAASQDYPMVKPTLDCNFVLNKKLDPRIGYTRKGVASFYDEQGILKIVGDNVPRFDHNPETRESLGILIEEERTNNQPHSEQWSPVQQDGFLNVISGMDVDYDPGVVTPTGETTGAITFMETGASGQHYIAFDVFGATVSGTSYTFSFFFKNISGGGSGNANNVKVITTTAAFPYMIRTFYFDGPDAGTTSSPSDSTITKLPNGWWRGTFTATANNNFGSAAWTMDLRGLNGGAAYNNKIAIWGIQTETGEFPTSYIRTGNSDYGRTATRGVDFLQIQGQAFTDLYNPVESTILCSYQHTKEVGSINASLGGSRRVYRFGTGDTSSDTRIDFVSTSTFHPFISADGTNVATITTTAPTLTSVNTYATRVKENDFATTKAGGSIVSDTSGAWDPVNKMIEVQIGGSLYGASAAALQAHYKRFTYYPVGLPNSQLITISS